MIGFAGFYRLYEPTGQHPGWVLALLAGIALLFAARYSLQQETAEYEEEWREFDDLEYGSIYDSSLYLESPGDHDNIAYSQWLTEKQEERRQEQLLLEAEEDELADGILEKLHQHGGDLSCLDPEERRILDRFSERIRRRRQQSV